MRIVRMGIAAASAALLTASAVVVPATGEDPAAAEPPVRVAGGLLAVETGVTDRVYLDVDSDGVPEAEQALTEAAKCLLGTDESLLAIDGFVGSDTSDVASFGDDAVGVAEKKSGQSCAQADAPAERLVLTLVETGLSSDIGPRLAASAYFDVELKQNATIRAVARLGESEVGVYELRSGSAVVPGVEDGDVVGGATVFNCVARADSGPDSTTGDNCRWPISAPSWLGPDDGSDFDSLEMTAVAGSFSLEGGSDGLVEPAPPAGLPERASFFELVTLADGELICGASTETLNTDGDAPEVTVRRLGNADPAETCELIPYTLRNASSSARFLKPLDTQTSAQFVFDMVWTVPAAGSMPLPVTTVDFEAGGGEIDLGWCPDPLYDGDRLVGIADPAGVPDLDATLPHTQFACVGTQDARVLDGDIDYVTIEEQIYVIGDIRLRK